jgi:hypothetical protein
MRHIFKFMGILLILGCSSESNKHNVETETSVNNGGENESKYSITVSGSCSYTGELSSDQVYGFPADNEAQQALNRIMDFTGLPVNFKLLAADVDNACAVLQRRDSGDMMRYIMYNQQFMLGVKDLTQNHWSEVSILAHEIGHHLSGHTLIQGGSQPDQELEADRFSGFILYKMGATLEDAQIAMITLASETASNSHPAKKSRLVAITNGWLAAREQENTGDFKQNNQTPDYSTSKNNVSISSTDNSVRERIISILNNYYQINEVERCEELADFYLPIVDNYFSKQNQTTSDIINECMKYHSRWPYQQMSFDNSTFSITDLSNGDYFVTYDMFYQVKRKMEDNWKSFDLTINVRFTPTFRIRSIYEYQKPNL